VGATGAFGKVFRAKLGNAGARLVIAAGNAAELDTLKGDLEAAGIEVTAIARRPNTERDCDAIVGAAVARFGAVILVVASVMHDVAPIVEMSPERFQRVMLANVDGG